MTGFGLRFGGAFFPLAEGKTTLGRSPDCNIVVTNPVASRMHCAVRVGGVAVKIIDLKSRNGTFVNNERVTGEQPLSNGDLIGVGTDVFELVTTQDPGTSDSDAIDFDFDTTAAVQVADKVTSIEMLEGMVANAIQSRRREATANFLQEAIDAFLKKSAGSIRGAGAVRLAALVEIVASWKDDGTLTAWRQKVLAEIDSDPLTLVSRWVGCGLVLMGLAGCREDTPSASSAPATPSVSSGSGVPERAAERASALGWVERRLSPEGVQDSDVGSTWVVVRRAAARSLARIADAGAADARAVDLLTSLLSDEDAAVVAWAAFGLGGAASGRQEAVVRKLAARAASWIAAPSPHGAPEPAPPFTPAPLFAISLALGQCGSSLAEQVLRGWLSSDPGLAQVAPSGLGRLGELRGSLDEATLVALLDAAAGSGPASSEALVAFSKVGSSSDLVRRRLREVASSAIARGAGGEIAVRALGRAGPEAAGVLGGLLVDPTRPGTLRAEAARELAALGDAGRDALGAALGPIAPEPDVSEKALTTPDGYLPLFQTVESLAHMGGPPAVARPTLEALARLPVTSGPVHNRAIRIRCAAAALLVGPSFGDARLVSCDPDGGPTGALAALEVVGRDDLRGARRRRWDELRRMDDRRVAAGAVRMLAAHPEAEDASRLVTEALASKVTGVAVAAAEVIAARPDVGALSMKPALEALCADPNPGARAAAEHALGRLEGSVRRCPAPTLPALAERALLSAPVTLVVSTSAGEHRWTLDPALSPASVTQIVGLAKAGFYDGQTVHRMIAGSVVQLGDPSGDGYGGAGLPLLRSEHSPVPFVSGSVGLAEAGRDSGSSQIFVVFSRAPHLDGRFAVLGQAEPGWEAVAEGDRIEKVTVIE